MKEAFEIGKFSSKLQSLLDKIIEVVKEYEIQGYKLTLRQLHYQLVSRGITPNTDKDYGKLSRVLGKARMIGLVDWDIIEDRLRIPQSPISFESSKNAMDVLLSQFALERMYGQEIYIEVWTEKDALSGVLSRITRKYHIPLMVCRGYNSITAIYDLYQRVKYEFKHNGRSQAKVLYLGDFDPSGLDMVRDIPERVGKMLNGQSQYFDLEQIALTIEQVRQYSPPPNPAKKTDTRYAEFKKKYGATSWEVDALPPNVLNQVLTEKIEENINVGLYKKMVANEQAEIEKLDMVKKYL